MNSIDELRRSLKQLHNEEEKSNVPEYVRRDIKPATAGRDMLHNEHGVLKNKGRKPPASTGGGTPPSGGSLFVLPAKDQTVTFGTVKRSIPTVGSQQQAWDVAGDIEAMSEDFSLEQIPSVTEDGFIDNNEYMDVDSVQGHRPWEEKKPVWQDNAEELFAQYKQLANDNDVVSFSKYFENKFGRGALKQFIQYVSKIESVESKKNNDAGPKQLPKQPVQSNSILNVKPKSYALIVAGNFVGEIETTELLERYIQDLVVNQGYNVEDIVVFQRKPVRFGISLG